MTNSTTKILATLLALGAPATVLAQDTQGTAVETIEETIDPRAFSPRNPYHFIAVVGIDTPTINFDNGFFAPLLDVQLSTQLGKSNWDLLGRITTGQVSLELRHQDLVDFSVIPYLRFVVEGDQVHHNANGVRDKDNETSASEFGGRLQFVTNEDNVLSGLLAHEFAGKTYGFPTAPASGVFPDNHFVHRTIFEAVIQRLEEDRALNLKEGAVLKLHGAYEFRPSFTSNVSGFENHEHTGEFASMFGLYFREGIFDLQTEFRGTVQIGADVYNAQSQGSMLSATAPSPGMSFKRYEHSQSVQANMGVGFLIDKNYHIQPGFNVLVLPGPNSVEGAISGPDEYIFLSATLRFDAKLGGVVPFGFRAGYLFPSTIPGELTGTNLGGLELMTYVAIGLGKIKQE